MIEMETRCRIPIWRTFGRIKWHVIPEPFATLQGAATVPPGKFSVMIQELRVVLQGAGEFNGMSSQSHISHCRVLPLGEFTVVIPEPYIAGRSHLVKSVS